jgi:hypothetical protein
MNYHSMTLQELKQVARDHVPPIKQYYIKPRAELIRLLSMKELPNDFVIEKMKISELREEARKRGFKNIWKMRRAELMDLLFPSTEENDKNHGHTKEHDNPQKGDSKDVGV